MTKRILLIDDEELIIRSLVKLFRKSGINIVVANNGKDALTVVEKEEFDLIISDVRMPGINGVETVRNIYEIMKKKGVKKSPVIFITGYADEEYEKEANDLNPVGYIYKPFDVIDLIGRVNEVLG